MSSEEMRVELETFVNAGLQEGWGGWPLKEESKMNRTSCVLHAGPIKFWRRQGNAATAPLQTTTGFASRRPILW